MWKQIHITQMTTFTAWLLANFFIRFLFSNRKKKRNSLNQAANTLMLTLLTWTFHRHLWHSGLWGAHRLPQAKTVIAGGGGRIGWQMNEGIMNRIYNNVNRRWEETFFNNRGATDLSLIGNVEAAPFELLRQRTSGLLDISKGLLLKRSITLRHNLGWRVTGQKNTEV